jgi:hypothetical protein
MSIEFTLPAVGENIEKAEIGGAAGAVEAVAQRAGDAADVEVGQRGERASEEVVEGKEGLGVERIESMQTRFDRQLWQGRFFFKLMAILGGLALVHWMNYKRIFAAWWRRLPQPAFAAAYGGGWAIVLLFTPAQYVPFIYFQF